MTGPRAFIAIPALVLALVVPLALPLASGAGAPDRWWGPGEARTWPATLDYANDLGTLRVLLADGPMDTKGHPFFEPLGSNGRACINCHQPADAMGLAAETARARWKATGGQGSAVRRGGWFQLPQPAPGNDANPIRCCWIMG